MNWSNGVVPGPNDTAEFSGSANSPYGSYVDTAFTVGALVIDSSWGTSGGAISVNAPLTLNGLSDGNSGQWSSGNMITLNADLINKGTFTLTGSGTQGLFVGGVTAYSLVNQGSIIQADPSNLTLNGAAVLDNQGSYTFQGDGDITGVLSVVYASTVINSGTITKDAGTGNSVINVTTLNNSGTFDVATGTLTLQPSNGTFTGGASTDFDVADGAVLNLLNGGSATFTGSISGMPTGPLHTGTVQFGSGTLGIGSGGATFNFPTGMFQWSGGRIDVSAGSLTNANALTLTGSGTQDLFGSVYGNALINQGTIVQAGPSNLTLTGAAVLNNQGSYTFQDDGDITGVLYVVYGSTVINSGTITKAAGTGNSVINVTTFNNSGMFDVATGTLTLQPTSGTFAGGASPLFNVADGAVVNLLNGGSATFTGTISGVPTGPAQTGIVQFNNGTLATGNGGATFNFPTGMFQWGGGRIDVSAGSLTNADALTLTGSGTQDLFGTLSGNALINQGTTVQAGPSNLTLTGAVLLNNQGSYTFQADGSISQVGFVGYAGSLTNSGTITKAAGTGNSVINVSALNDSGTFNVASGTLTLQPTSGTFAGGASPLFNVADGAVVNLLNGGSATFTGTISGVPTGPAQTGIVQFNNGTLTIGSGGATFDFPTGMFQWSGGHIDVSAGSLTNANALTLTGSGTQDLFGGTVPNINGNALINQGTIVQAGPSNLTLTGDAWLNNQGSYTFQDNGNISGVASFIYAGTVTNSGTITKAAGTGTSVINVATFSSTGTVEALSGTLSIPSAPTVSGGTLGSGTWIVGANSTLSLNANISTLAAAAILQGPGANFTNLPTVTSITSTGQLVIEGGLAFSTSGNLSNAGTINLEPGTLNVGGTYTQTSVGALGIGLGGLTAGTQFGQLIVNGTASLDGTLNVSLINEFAPAVGNSFQIMTFGSRSPADSDFPTKNGLNLSNGLVFTPVYHPTDLTLTTVQASQSPTITTNPTNQTVTASQTATFMAAASGNPTPTVQWQVSTDGGNTFSSIAGATIATLSFTAAAAQNGDEYRAVFSNSVGTATTSAATLTVDFAPTVTSNPTNQTVNAGETASFTAAASDGNPTPTTVQWQVSTDGGNTFSNIPGATIATLSFTTIASQNGDEYQAVFSNAAGLSATTSRRHPDGGLRPLGHQQPHQPDGQRWGNGHLHGGGQRRQPHAHHGAVAGEHRRR